VCYVAWTIHELALVLVKPTSSRPAVANSSRPVVVNSLRPVVANSSRPVVTNRCRWWRRARCGTWPGPSRSWRLFSSRTPLSRPSCRCVHRLYATTDHSENSQAESCTVRAVINSRTTMRRNVKQFRGGLVFKARRLGNHSTLASRVLEKKQDPVVASKLHVRGRGVPLAELPRATFSTTQ